MIASRITKNADLLKNEYKIDIYDANDALRSTYDILADLAPKWKTMGDAQRVALGDTLAGTNQYKVLAAVMGNFDSALKAHEIALNSAGSASRENEKAIDSLAGHLNQLKAQFEALANRVISSDFLKSLLDAGAGILKFANSDIGQAVIKMAAFTLGFRAFASVGSKLVSSVLPLLKDGLMGILALFQNLSMNAGKFLGTTLDGIAESIAAINPATLIVTGVALATIVEQTFSADAQFNRLNKKLSETKTELEDVSNEYEELSSRSDLSTSEKVRLEYLKSQKEVLQEQTAELAKQALLAKQATKATVVGGLDGVGGGLGTGAAKVENLQQKLQKLAETTKNLTELTAEQNAEWADYVQTCQEVIDSGGDLDDINQQIYDSYIGLANQQQVVANSIDYLSSQYNLASQAIDECNSSGYVNESLMNQLLSVYPQLNGQITQTTNGYKLEEGALSLLNDEAYSAKSAALQFASGQGAMQIATNATTQEIRNQIVAMLQQANAARDSYINQQLLTGKTMSEIRQFRSKELVELDANISKIYQALTRLDAGMLEIIPVTQDYTDIIDTNTSSTDENTKSKDENTKALEEQQKALKEANKELDKQKKKLDDLTESYQNAADAYKITADYMVSQIDKEIDALQKKRDTIEDTYNKQIEAAEKAHDKTVDLANEEYEKSVKSINKTYDAKIKAKESDLEKAKQSLNKINEENDALEEQIALSKAQQALAEAKQKKVLIYSGGQLKYSTDANAVQQAQANLDELKREQATKKSQKDAQAKIDKLESQIDKLEQDKEARLGTAEALRDAKIEIADHIRDTAVSKAESTKDKQLSTIDKQIANYEKYKEQWESLGTAYEEEQNKLIAQQVLGIKLEGDNWKKRLKQADKYVTKYKTIMKRLGVLEGFEVDVDTGSVTSINKAAKAIKNLLSNYKTKTPSLPNMPKGFASGTTNSPSGLSMVGENGRELRVLNGGDGIISHNLTENLMKLGQYSPTQWIDAISGTFANRTPTVVQQFGDISLPNVTNANQFVEQLKQFKNYAVQATSRR